MTSPLDPLLNPARLHESWFSGFFASSGALFANVLSNFQNNLYSWGQLILSLIAFYCFAHLSRLRSGAVKEENIGETNSFERIKSKSLILYRLAQVLPMKQNLFNSLFRASRI